MNVNIAIYCTGIIYSIRTKYRAGGGERDVKRRFWLDQFFFFDFFSQKNEKCEEGHSEKGNNPTDHYGQRDI